jgi:hypothetical protein
LMTCGQRCWRIVAGVVMFGCRESCVLRLQPVRSVGTGACRKRVQPDRNVLNMRMLHDGGTPNSCATSVPIGVTGCAVLGGEWVFE